MSLRNILCTANLFCIVVHTLATSLVDKDEVVHYIPFQFDQIELWRNYEYLVDSSASLTLREVMENPNWVKATQIKNFGFTKMAVWARYHIQQSTNAPEAYVVPQTVTMDSIHFFVQTGDEVIHNDLCGDHLDYDTREVEFQACAFQLVQTSDPQTLYLRFRTSGPLTLPVTIRERQYFQKNIFYETYLYGIHFGLFLLVSLYHFILFFFLRERSLLLYAIYVLVAGIVGTVVNGLLPELFFRQTGESIDGLMVLLTGVSVFFYCWFVLDFLIVKQRSAFLHKLFLVMMGLGSLLMIAHFVLPLAQTSAPAGLLSLTSHTLVLITTIFFFLKGHRDTGLLLIASSIFLIMAILFALRVVGAIPINFLTENGLEIGAALEVILISISLGSKFRRTAIEKESLASVSQFKEAMTGMIAHDLKNPLSVLNLKAASDPESQAMTRQMLHLVTNMLDVQKLESAAMPIQKKSLNLLRLVEASSEQVRHLLREKNIKLDIEISPNEAVLADNDLLHRVIVNLLTNAIKYSPLNGEIEFSSVLEGETQTLSVKDQGPGISKEQQESIFDPFGQIDPLNSGGVASTGLGLTFCKLVLQAHGSQIQVDSEPGKGAKFWFTLEAVTAKAGEPSVKEAAMVMTDKDRKTIIAAIPKLKQFELHQAVEMEEVLESLSNTESAAVRLWVESVLNAAYAGNEESFEELLAEVEST